MENENVSTEQTEEIQDTRSQLNKVTPLSKYLAMGLFVVLPFLGGWIGYQYAPEKVVQVDIFSDPSDWALAETNNGVKTEEEILQLRLLLAKKSFPQASELEVGDSLGVFLMDSVEYQTEGGEGYYQHRANVNFTGTTTISGRILVDRADMAGSESPDTSYSISFEPTVEDAEKLPSLEDFTPSKGKSINVSGLEKMEIVQDMLVKAGCSEDLSVWCKDFDATRSEMITVIISGFELYGQSYPSGLPYRPSTTLVEQ
jgi:hypothetical protein